MYQNYFGFRERPFQLVPNPAYLFLSRSHEEAMAHLTYAVMEGDGFITITGEVGTGKTTLCRAFIESLDERIEVAYIFNPKLSAVELLKTVCDEFGIGVANENTTKELIDALNRFLMKIKEEGRRVMLIIDEAQNLSREVLEQIRLLSNLETSTEKLLQIVLAGQPEMGDLLDSHELRQLSQRITLRCRLMPLTQPESVQYIQHRVQIAARKNDELFTPAAFRKIHSFSKGIPRLIHIVCDRALLVAYVTSREKVTGAVVDTAIRELNPLSEANRAKAVESRKTLLLAALLCLLVILLFTVSPMDSGKTPATDSSAKRETAAVPSDPVPSTAPGGKSSSGPDPAAPGTLRSSAVPSVSIESASPGENGAKASSLAAYLKGISLSGSKESALAGVLSLWGKEPPFKEYPGRELIDPGTYFRLTARENGFLVHQVRGGLGDISMLNLPAILELRLPAESENPYFLALVRMDGDGLTFLTENGGELKTAVEDAIGIWAGNAHVPWINFFDCGGIVPIDCTGEDVLELKGLLEKIGFDQLGPGPYYDIQTEKAVMEIQQRHGLPIDGLVGPLTKIAIYNELPGLNIPHIRKNGGGPPAAEPKVTD